MPPSIPFSSRYGWQRVCAKYCCEHWVVSHSAHTVNRCYSETNKTQTYSKREHFSSFLITSLMPPLGGLPLETIKPLATRAQAWQAIPGVSDWVLGLIKWGYTLQFTRRPRCGLHIGSPQHRSHPAQQSDEFGGEKSRGNSFPSPERVRLLQPLLPRAQEGWWSKTHSRSQKS